MAEGRNTSGGFSSLVAMLALAISLASAGWSVFAYVKSSEIRPLQFEEVYFLNEENVAQIQIEITVANLAYGDYDDVARTEEITLENGDQRLRFVARAEAIVTLVSPPEDGVYPRLQHPCRWGGLALMVCTKSESPVVALPAGEVAIHYPIFELAYDDCGRASCETLTRAELAEFLVGDVRVTYAVTTMRDGVQTVSCGLKIPPENAAYYRDVGWFNPGCEGVL